MAGLTEKTQGLGRRSPGQGTGTIATARRERRSACGLAWLGVAVLALGLGSCQGQKSAEDKIAADTKAAEDFQGDLIFKNVTLNNLGTNGKLQWEVKAQEARYSRDRKYAKLVKPSGKLYENGKVIYEITGGLGEILDNGQILKVRDRVRAKNIVEKAEFQAATATWQPEKSELNVQGGFILTHHEAIVSGREATAFNRDRRIEIQKTAALRSKNNQLRVTSEKLTWDLAKREILSMGKTTARGTVPGPSLAGAGTPAKLPITIVGKKLLWQMAPDQVTLPEEPVATLPTQATTLKALRMVWNLKGQTMLAEGKVVANRRDPATILTSDRLMWHFKDQYARAMGQPIVTSAQPAATAQADLMTWEFKTNAVLAVGNVTAVGRDPAMTLTTDRLIWQMKDRLVQAVGAAHGVSGDPAVDVTADRLIWQLGDRVAQAVGSAHAVSRDPAVTLRGDRFVWQLTPRILQAIGQAQAQRQADGQNSAVTINADRLIWQTKERVGHAVGRAVAVSPDPNLRVQTEHLVWQAAPQVVSAVTPSFIERFRCAPGAACTVVDRARGNLADVSLRDRTAWLRGQAYVSAADPAVDVASESLRWNFRDQQMGSDTPVTVLDRRQNITLTALRGALDLRAKVAELTGQVSGTAPRRQARMNTDRLVWALDRQEVQAFGHVFYQQNQPYLRSQGDRAVAFLKNNTIVLNGGSGMRATSTFFPEPNGQRSASAKPGRTNDVAIVPRDPLAAVPPIAGPGLDRTAWPAPTPLPIAPSDLSAGSLPAIPTSLFNPGSNERDFFLAPFRR